MRYGVGCGFEKGRVGLLVAETEQGDVVQRWCIGAMGMWSAPNARSISQPLRLLANKAINPAGVRQNKSMKSNREVKPWGKHLGNGNTPSKFPWAAKKHHMGPRRNNPRQTPEGDWLSHDRKRFPLRPIQRLDGGISLAASTPASTPVSPHTTFDSLPPSTESDQGAADPGRSPFDRAAATSNDRRHAIRVRERLQQSRCSRPALRIEMEGVQAISVAHGGVVRRVLVYPGAFAHMTTATAPAHP